MKIEKFEQAIRKDDFSIGDSLRKLCSRTAKQQEADKMKYEEEKLIKPILDRLAEYGTFISNKAPPLNKEKALILLGEAMLKKFVDEFTSLWRNELFSECQLMDFEASGEEIHKWVHGSNPQPDCIVCSKLCKEVNDKMDTDTKKRLSSYIELFEEISKKVTNETTAGIILTEIAKDRRTEQMKKERESKNSDAVTFRQKKCMQNLGIEFPENITRKEASVLIQEEIERLNGVGE
jgi:hypothetical protein